MSDGAQSASCLLQQGTSTAQLAENIHSYPITLRQDTVGATSPVSHLTALLLCKHGGQ